MSDNSVNDFIISTLQSCQNFIRKMYKKYSAQQQQVLKEVTKVSSNGIEVDVEKVIADCWNIIDTQCIANSATAGKLVGSNVSSVRKGKWRTVRLFVSSTFVDYFNEREVLVKKVGDYLFSVVEYKSSDISYFYILLLLIILYRLFLNCGNGVKSSIYD